MPTTTPIQGFPVPVGTDDPDVVDDMTKLAKAIEKRVVGVYATAAARDTATAPQEEGMVAFTRDFNKLWYHDGTAWIEFVPRDTTLNPAIRSGAAVPSNTLGVDGDVFIKY
jgi:hypothetical protein